MVVHSDQAGGEISVNHVPWEGGRLLAFSRDITERKRMEEEVEALARFPSENPNPVIRVTPDGNILYSNAKAKPLIAAWEKRTSQEEKDERRAYMGRLYASGETDSYESEEFGKIWRHTFVPVVGAGYLNVYSEDITERKQLEERLRQSEKMDSIGQLAGGIAHDFNNQLGGIMGFAGLLKEYVKDEKLHDYAEMIAKLCEQSKDLTGKLLAFSRKGKYQVLPVDIHKAVPEIVSMLKHSIDKRVRIRQTLSADPSFTAGDPSQLQNVLLNLSLNARDAMPEGGDLAFATGTVALDKAFCRNCPYDIAPGNYLRISVTDTGTGMDQETQKRMFEPFFTTKAQGEGTGMGLASAYGTVVNHHGAIEVDSELGRGTTVTVYLPSAEAPEPVKTATEAKATPATGEARILLVDDEGPIRLTVPEMLRARGFKVVTCEDGAEAVEYYRKSWQHIDLVILDMTMPVLSGRDAFAAMREINPEIKAILSTGYSLDSRAQEILDEGVLSFIQKPFHIDQLVETVTGVLEA